MPTADAMANMAREQESRFTISADHPPIRLSDDDRRRATAGQRSRFSLSSLTEKIINEFAYQPLYFVSGHVGPVQRDDNTRCSVLNIGGRLLYSNLVAWA